MVGFGVVSAHFNVPLLGDGQSVATTRFRSTKPRTNRACRPRQDSVLFLSCPEEQELRFQGEKPLRFAAPSAWVQKGGWAGLRVASASSVTLCWRGATRRLGLCVRHSNDTARQHTRPAAEGRPAPATRATGSRKACLPFWGSFAQTRVAGVAASLCAGCPLPGPMPDPLCGGIRRYARLLWWQRRRRAV